MAGSIYAWDVSAASNSSSDGDINWAEGQAPSTVNNSARQMMGRLAEFIKDQGGALVAAGTANGLTLTANSNFTAYATGQVLAFKASADNTGAATLNVNGIGAKSLRKFTSIGESALEAGDIKDDGIFAVRYDGAANSAAGGWVLQNPVVSLSGLAALTLTSTDAGAGVGPSLNLYRNSASPAASDFIGAVNFQGEDSAGNTDTYARIYGQVNDPTSTNEDASVLVDVDVAGALMNVLTLSGAGSTITRTDNGAAGPVINYMHESASPAASDVILQINAKGRDSAGNQDTYALIQALVTDPTSTSEDAEWRFSALSGGSVGSTILRLSQAGSTLTSNLSISTGNLSVIGGGSFTATGGGSLTGTWSDLGTVNTVSIVGGTINNVVIGGSSAAAGTFTTGTFNTSWSVGTFSLIGATAGKACAATNLQSSREGTSTLGHQQFYNPNGLVGTISTNASATSYTTSSDERKKTDFRDFDSGSIIDLLKIYFFAWRKGGTGYGVKAQEAREVFPDAISEGEDGYLQADYSKFVPLLIREIQSLRARVAAIEEH